MSDDLSSKFAQISELLNQEGMAENIKGLIGMLSKSSESQESPVENTEPEPVRQEKPVNRASPRSPQPSKDIEQDLEMMRQVQKVMEVMRGAKDDPRINLLNAIMPYMNPTRQKKVSNAMRLLQITSISKLMDKDGKSLFKL